MADLHAAANAPVFSAHSVFFAPASSAVRCCPSTSWVNRTADVAISNLERHLAEQHQSKPPP
jgi:hypothetical protein